MNLRALLLVSLLLSTSSLFAQWRRLNWPADSAIQNTFLYGLSTWRDSVFFIRAQADSHFVHLATRALAAPRRLGALSQASQQYTFYRDTIYGVGFGDQLEKVNVRTRRRSSESLPQLSRFRQLFGRTQNFLALWDSTTLFFRPFNRPTWTRVADAGAAAANADRIYYLKRGTLDENSLVRISPTGVAEPLRVPGLKGDSPQIFAHDSIVIVGILEDIIGQRRQRLTLHLSTNRGNSFRRIDGSAVTLPRESSTNLNFWEARYQPGNLFVLARHLVEVPNRLWVYNEADDVWSAYEAGLPATPRSLTAKGDTLVAVSGRQFNHLFARATGTLSIYSAKGRIFLDINNNGVFDAGDRLQPGVGIRTSRSGGVYFSRADGTFVSATDVAIDTHSVVLPNPRMTAIPARFVTNRANVQGDIVLKLPANERDLIVNLNTSTVFRPGFETSVGVVVRNELLGQNNITVRLTFEPSKLSYQGASSAPTVVDSVAGFVQWSVGSLSALSDTVLGATFLTRVTTPLGAIINMTASAQSAATDVTPADNTAPLRATVVGSFDPNDKLVSSDLFPIQSPPRAERLTYTIRFQNTGSFQADFVILCDTLDAARFDLGSIEILKGSHPFTASLQKNILKATFNSINLVPQRQSEANSQGFLTFSIRTKGPLAARDQIRNRAGIYFDYNPVVLTDFALTRVDFVTDAPEIPAGIPLSVSPNPAALEATIQRPADWADQTLRVTAIGANGAQLSEQELVLGQSQISLRDCPPGLILLHIACPKGRGWAKIIRQ